MNRTLRTVLVASTALLMATPCPAELLKVRSGVGVKGGVDAYLVSVALPAVQLVEPGQDPEALLTRLCGSVTDAYRIELKKLNPVFAWSVQEEGRTFQAPPCFYDTRSPRTFELKAGMTLRQFADLHMGAAGKLTLGPILDGNPELKAEADAKGLDAETAGDLVFTAARQVTVPFETQETIHELKPDRIASKVIAEIERRLGARNGAAAIVEAQSNDALPIATRAGDDRSCGLKSPPDNWPFNAAALIAVLDDDTISVAPVRPAIVAIVDSGLADLPAQFPPELFADPNARGANVAMNTSRIAPYDTDVYASHGTEMASQVIGGPAFVKAYGYAAIAKRIKLIIVGIVQKDGSVPSSNLPQAVKYAAEAGADVVSMSLVTSDARNLLKDVIYSKGNILVLAAAGNAPYDLSTTGKYPASYGGAGGDLKGRVLTSAAWLWNGTLAYWSAKGAVGVDVAAPGCLVPSVGSDGLIAERNGSSSASAQTAFVAALLRSMAPKQSAEWIKTRILSSLDYKPGPFSNDVAGAGVVNPIKAVALRRTVLERTEKVLEFVDLDEDLETTDLCEGAPASRTMMKLSWDSATSTIRYGYKLPSRQFASGSCAPIAGAVVRFKPAKADPASPYQTVPVQSVIDLVVAESGFSAAATTP